MASDDEVSSQSSEEQSSSEDGSPPPRQVKNLATTQSNGASLLQQGLTPAASSSASVHDDYDSDLSTDDEEPPIFDWMNCEAPPPQTQQEREKKVWVLDRNTKSVWEGRENSDYIAVRGRENTNRQINGIYQKQADGTYKKEVYCEMDTIYLFRAKNGKCWRFAPTTDSEFSYAYGRDVAESPQRVVSPWLVFDPDTKEFVEDTSIRIAAIKEAQKDTFEVFRRRRLSEREKAIVSTLAYRGKTAQEIAVLTQLNVDSVEVLVRAANHAKWLLKVNGANVAGEEEPPLKRKEREDIEKELKRIGKSTKEIDFALSAFLSDKSKEKAEKQVDFMNIVGAILHKHNPPKEKPRVVEAVTEPEKEAKNKDAMVDVDDSNDAIE